MNVEIFNLINVQLKFYNQILESDDFIYNKNDCKIEMLTLIYDSFEQYKNIGITFFYDSTKNKVGLLEYNKEKYINFIKNK